jgi:hypothetical protein
MNVYTGQNPRRHPVLTKASQMCTVRQQIQKESGARILKHSVEAEKSTFQGELAFQRSECTAGLTVAIGFFVLIVKSNLCKQLYL